MSNSNGLLSTARRHLHEKLIEDTVLSFSSSNVASIADSGSASSRRIAAAMLYGLGADVHSKLAGQTAGGLFEERVASFLRETFPRLDHLRPGTWRIERVGGTSKSSGVSRFAQYAHLDDLDEAIKANPTLETVLGNAYSIAPDVIVTRYPVNDDVINNGLHVVDTSSALHADLRACAQAKPILHAVISCKLTVRSDRAQNSRSEALNLIRNRKGQVPHIVVVTAEPSPNRLASLALGTGDIDCVYSFALQELREAVLQAGSDDSLELLDMMIKGRRLKDISDLPLDLAV